MVDVILRPQLCEAYSYEELVELSKEEEAALSFVSEIYVYELKNQDEKEYVLVNTLDGVYTVPKDCYLIFNTEDISLSVCNKYEFEERYQVVE